MNKKGFTLIELLLVIGILGALAAAVMIAINPTRRLNQANDTKVKNDIDQVSTALAAYFTTNGYYPGATGDLVTSQDLTTYPTAPTGYTAYTFAAIPAGCTAAAGTCTAVAVSGQLKAPKATSNTMWCYKSSTGVVTETTVCTP